jgi:hypothetical protein
LGDTIGKDEGFSEFRLRVSIFQQEHKKKVQDDEMTEQFLFDSIEGAEIREEDDE